MKWLRLWVLSIMLLSVALLLSYEATYAETSTEVTITATGFICEAPGGFTLTYISDYEVGISWTKGEGAVNTMVRARYGLAPTSRTDGYLVYYGSEASCSDTGVSLDEMGTPVYYRAWSENANGIWEEVGTSDFMEGYGMTLIAFVLLCLGLMISGFVLKNIALMFSGGLAWIGLGIYGINSASLQAAGIDSLILSLGLALSMVCFVYSFLVARKPKPEKPRKKTTEDEVYEGLRDVQRDASRLRGRGRR